MTNKRAHTHTLTPQLPPSSLIVYSPPPFSRALPPAWCGHHASETLGTESQRVGHDTVHTSHLCSGAEHTVPDMFKHYHSSKFNKNKQCKYVFTSKLSEQCTKRQQHVWVCLFVISIL